MSLPLPFSIMTLESAPESSVPFLSSAQADFGMIPNLERVMAGAPALLGSYVSSWEAFNETALSAIERQVVYQTVNFENNCEYCVPWHTILSEQAGMSEEDVDALRHGANLSDKRHEALRAFTQNMVRARGNIAPSELQAFFDAGYKEQHAMEVVLGIAIKTMSNYTNAIAQTPLDKAAEKKRWKKPSLREQQKH